ncbi:unnamed protein product [Cylicocyclus nassatus]|uniref:SXP/RAL-2 family protein Ani s 5-like cation-binding domain-containing protein n=1 Tax=Cylicocyclus nassatus TaxID=53992 RepID=A0AA36H5C5_CYLNA|nr:unnamed protein product [Cylicocyclus nassatus]
MMLLAFACLISSLRAFAPGGPPSFPIPPQALEDLRRLHTDPSLTKQQFEEALAQWAEQYGLTNQYAAYKKLLEEQTSAAERELDEAIQNLPYIIEELRQIENDNALTMLQASQREMEIINRLTPKQQRLLRSAGHIFALAYLQPRPGPGGVRPGPFGPGPYGPGPFGPGPYGPDPYGPGPRRPGPHGPGPRGPGPWGPRGPRGF